MVMLRDNITITCHLEFRGRTPGLWITLASARIPENVRETIEDAPIRASKASM